MMDHYLSPQSPEAQAYTTLTENWFLFDTEHPSLNETLIAGCAAYQSLQRYLSGQDIFIWPRNIGEVQSILHRYAYDSIHNSVAQARSQIQKGGYIRMCCLARKSIADVLRRDDNGQKLLALHLRPQDVPLPEEGEPFERPQSRSIQT